MVWLTETRIWTRGQKGGKIKGGKRRYKGGGEGKSRKKRKERKDFRTTNILKLETGNNPNTPRGRQKTTPELTATLAKLPTTEPSKETHLARSRKVTPNPRRRPNKSHTANNKATGGPKKGKNCPNKGKNTRGTRTLDPRTDPRNCLPPLENLLG